MEPVRPVVVGTDGSASGAAALLRAVDEAEHPRRPLRVLHAMDVRYGAAFSRANPVFVADERRAAEEVLDAAVAAARAAAPGLDVRGLLAAGPPAAALVEQAADADLVVVGCRGRGGFTGLLLGSTSRDVAMRAPGAVLVVRPGGVGAGPSAGRVVVGVDGEPQSADALAFAFARAAERGLGLTAVHVARSPAVYVDMPVSHRWDWAEEAARTLLTGCLAGWRERCPGVDVVARAVLGNAAAVLVGESVGAELLVVGSRGRGRVGGLLLGSVGHAVLHHAGCPVAVVHPRRAPLAGD